MKKTLLVLALVGAALAGPTWLARVDLADGRSGRDLFDSGLTVVRDYGTYCLVLAAAEQLDRPGLIPLDAMASDRVWTWVLTRSDFDRNLLAAYGRTLLEDGPSVLLATTEDGVAGLNRLPVELARIGTQPLVYSDLSGPPPMPAVDDSLVRELVNRVSEDSVLGTIRRQQNFYTRYSTTDSCRSAANWMRSKFVDYGCDSTALETFRSTYAPNVIGVKKGKLDPTKIYIIDGHLDNTSDYEPNRCPGSDDNASGTTAVLEACRVFQDVDFDYTVYFIGFTGEEQGLIGSDSFASRAYRRHDSIRAVLNFDMISYGRQNRDSLEVIGKSTSPNCNWLVDAYRANCDTFAQLKTKKTMTSGSQYDYSDHAPFWWKGYFAFCGIERDFTPRYHTIGDTIGTLYYTNCGTNNWPMATKAIKAGVATLAKLAGARLPTGIEEGGEPLRPAQLLEARPALGPSPVTLYFSAPARPGARVEAYDAIGRQVGTMGVGGLRTVVGPKTRPGIYLFRLVDGELTSTARAVVTE